MPYRTPAQPPTHPRRPPSHSSDTTWFSVALIVLALVAALPYYHEDAATYFCSVVAFLGMFVILTGIAADWRN